MNYIMGIPGADDVMLQYHSTSFHDALYLRKALGLRPAPEFEAWLDSDLPSQLALPSETRRLAAQLLPTPLLRTPLRTQT